MHSGSAPLLTAQSQQPAVMRSTILDDLLPAQTSGMFPSIKRVFILITLYQEQLGDTHAELIHLF